MRILLVILLFGFSMSTAFANHHDSGPCAEFHKACHEKLGPSADKKAKGHWKAMKACMEEKAKAAGEKGQLCLKHHEEMMKKHQGKHDGHDEKHN